MPATEKACSRESKNSIEKSSKILKNHLVCCSGKILIPGETQMTASLLSLLLFLATPDPIASVLLDEGNKAYNAGDSARAAVLYDAYLQFNVPNRDILVRLAELYQALGRNDQAQPLFSRAVDTFCAPNCKENCLVEAECKRYREILRKIAADPPEDDQVPVSVKVPEVAAKVFSSALELKKDRKYDQARLLMTVALKLDPDMVGVYRHLGEIYEQLKDQKQADEFYLWYLRVRPAGPLAAQVRKKLSRQVNDQMAKLTITSSWSCFVAVGSETLTDAKGKPIKTPIKDLTLPPGRYAIGYICPDQHLARREWVTLAARQTLTKDFGFGVIAVNLTPWARILAARNDSGSNPQFMDLGLFDVIGLPAGSYILKLTAFDKSKTKTMNLEIKPKQTVKITQW